jgi:hypothetical protein
MKKRLWVLGILLSMTVACQAHPMEKEATPAGSRLAPPTVRHTPTFPPLETNTPNPTGAIPSTLTPALPALPPGWWVALTPASPLRFREPGFKRGTC